MDSLSSTRKIFDVDIVAPTGSVAKRPYIRGIATVSTNNSSTDFRLEVRLGAGKTYTHTFTGYNREESANYGTSDIKVNIYSGNQITNLALGGIWKDAADDNVPVYGFWYDSSANETYVLYDDSAAGTIGNGSWAMTPSMSNTTASDSNLCYPVVGAPSNGERHTVPFNVFLPETTVATTFRLFYSGSGYLRGLHGEAGYLR
jgi:hypothetical protein